MTEKDVDRVATEALVSRRTVWKWLHDPGSVNDNNRKRIEIACKKLRVKR
jgi:DNA-binding LacI/PurR family transcriptional regulator